jgi:hypothetical protein
LVPELSSPSGLKLYERPGAKNARGFLSTTFKAIQHNGDYALVQTAEGTRGWLNLLNLSSEPSEVSNFCGALIRFFRRDWSGAIEMFEPVTRERANGSSPTPVKVAAYLYMAMAADRRNDKAKAITFAENAYRLNPYSKTTVQFLCMSHLARFAQLHNLRGHDQEKRRTLATIRQILSSNKILFSDRDEWLSNVNAFLAEASQ